MMPGIKPASDAADHISSSLLSSAAGALTASAVGIYSSSFQSALFTPLISIDSISAWLVPLSISRYFVSPAATVPPTSFVIITSCHLIQNIQ